MSPRDRFLKRKYVHRTLVESNGQYLPVDRRLLQRGMVDHSFARLFYTCVQLRLFKRSAVDSWTMNDFTKALYKLVKRRHTNLWNTTPTSLKELVYGLSISRSALPPVDSTVLSETT